MVYMCESAMDIKQLEVEKWLQSIYGSRDCVPEYEKNSKSIDLLYQLMTCSKNTEAKAQILLQDCITKTEEYRAKGEQITSVLQGINLAKTNLSLDAQQALSNIADAACAVNAFSPSESDIMLGYNRLEMEHDKVTDKCDAAHHLQAQLFDLSQQLASKLEHITNVEHQAAAAEALEQQELEGNRKRELFHEKKVAEYQAEIRNREAELQHCGYNATSTHDIAHERWQQLLELREKVSSLQHKLESYSLPPDVTTARLAVEEMRHSLNALMSDVATLQMK